MLTHDYLNETKDFIKPLTQKIADHPIYKHINTQQQLCVFSQFHVFAVYDFMCLIKTLQQKLTHTAVPWFPPQNALGAHLINNIMAEEEGDIDSDGSYKSHFELYIEAMRQAGAEIKPVLQFINTLQDGLSLSDAMNIAHVPSIARNFVNSTFTIIHQSVEEITAAFLFGREDITAKMFRPLVEKLGHDKQLSKFIYYFQRHIDLDSCSHSEKATQLLVSLCGDDQLKWLTARQSAQLALQARLHFLDGIHSILVEHQTRQVVADEEVPI